MSTKTTFKRVALVAVAALGLGVVSSVAPASAAAEMTYTSLSVGAATPARAGLYTNTTITVRQSAVLTAGDTMTVGVRVLTAPATSLVKGTSVTSNSSGGVLAWTASTSNYSGTIANAAYADVTIAGIKHVGASADFPVTTAGVSAGSRTMGATLSFKPDVEGTYTLLVSAGNAAYTTGDVSAVWTVTTVGTPTGVALSSVNSTTSIDNTTGSLVKVVLTDASGNVTMPGVGEAISLSSSDASFTFSSTAAAANAITALDSTNGFTTYGFGYFYAPIASADTTAQTGVITAQGSGLIASSVLATITLTGVVPTAAIADIDLGDGTAVSYTTAATTGAGYAWSSSDAFTVSAGQTSHIITMASTASATVAKYYDLTITDTNGKVSGISGATVATVATQAAAATVAVATKTISASLGTSSAFSVSDGTDTVTLTGAPTTLDSVTIDQGNLRSAVGGTITVTATAYDNFGVEMPSAGVSLSVAGRNTVAATLKTTDADGRVTFSYTDAGTAATSNTLDTVTLTPTGATSDSISVTWGAYTVGTVTVTGGATADTVAYPAAGATTKAISTAVAGAGAGTTTFTATVKDASGNLLAGVPVTWSVDKATSGITKTLLADSATCYTGSAGTCTTTVFAWEAPLKVTVTATSGGKTGTGHQNFVNAATDARVLSASVSGQVVTAKVVDRYGNPVSGVTVSAATSAGYFGAGATSTTGVTATNGTVGFALVSASATVTLTLDSAVYTQTDDAAGKVGTTAVTSCCRNNNWYRCKPLTSWC